jgi:hypothetical protein
VKRIASRSLGPVALAIGALWSSSCAPGGFADSSGVSTVRVLASSADKPYAAPGDMVNLQLLAYDGRPTKSAPMTIYWLPFVCENPLDDAYFGCFAQFAAQLAGGRGSADGGVDTDGGGGGFDDGRSRAVRPGVHIQPRLRGSRGARAD